MSYAVPGQPPSEPEQRPRPGTVTAATWLLLLVAVLYLVGAAVNITQVGTFTDVYETAYEGTELEGSGATGSVTIVAGSVINVLFAIGFIVLALLNHQGRNPSRIVTWVVGGIALCCNGLGFAATGLINSMQGDIPQGPNPAEIQRMIDEATPAWYGPLTNGSTIVSILALLVALILLALPPSNAFFRKPPPAFEPPPAYPPAS